MVVNFLASKTDPPVAALVVANMLRSNVCVSVTWGTKTALELPGATIDSTINICRYLARASPESSLYGSHALHKTEVDHWLLFSSGPLASNDQFNKSVEYLNQVLGPATYLVGNQLSLADLCVWGTLYKSKAWANVLLLDEPPVNATRWYKFINSLDAVTALMSSLPEAVVSLPGTGKQVQGGKNKEEVSKNKDEGKFIELPGAEKGKVVVRFPPEASGYLHIGHAKAALLNQYYKDAYEGKLIMRFDDTNPAKEKIDFEQVILEDLKLLKITPDEFTHTSNYFELMLELCEKLLHQGLAYVDDTDAETMKLEREQRAESRNRNNSIEKNLKMWAEMKIGSKLGQKCCVRAKIDMNSANGCMRDPTIYRCKNEPHPRTGTKYKVYPTYDFACPIVDSVEGVTHCLRTMEYHDRDEQFFWFINALELRKPEIWEYSRLNMMNTVLSKRKLTWFVDEGFVDGWDDPRFPTVRGIVRRGMTVEGLKQFIVAQGSSRSVVLMEWDKIWAFNKKVIDPVAPRYTSLALDNVPVLVQNVAVQPLEVAKHPKDSSIGKKTIFIGPRVLIDREDADTLKEGENATFINWGNLLIKKINRKEGKISSVEALPNLENTDYKKTVKLTWLAETDKAPFVPCLCVYFDHIISKAVLGKEDDFKDFVNKDTRKEVVMLGDPELLKVKKSDIIQLQRRGFFICDREYAPRSIYSGRELPVVLFYIPDGRAKEMATSGAPKDAPITETVKVIPPTKAAPPSTKSVAPLKVTGPGSSEVSVLHSVDLDNKIKVQGDVIRKLKSSKADKDAITKEVNVLLKLKADFKTATGIDWKPGVQLPTVEASSSALKSVSKDEKTFPSGQISPESLHNQIVQQGDKVRQLKSQKVVKDAIDAEVKVLLNLKAEFKTITGVDWKPATTVPSTIPSNISEIKKPPVGEEIEKLSKKILEQGDKVRSLKLQKAQKATIDAEVKVLLKFKADFKEASGQDWKPPEANSVTTPQFQTTPAMASTPKGLIGEIMTLVSKINELKTTNTPADVITSENNKLLKLQNEFQKITELKWDNMLSVDAALVYSTIVAAQGDYVRQLKTAGSDKTVLDEQIKKLLKVKSDYKILTGEDYAPSGSGSSKSSKSKDQEKKKPLPQKTKEKQVNSSATKKVDDKKQTRLGLEALKEDNLAEWYSQVITKGELIEYFDVSGCYIYRPWSYAIWDFIKEFFDCEIKKLGVQNCYFPLFVSRAALEKEKSHIADFSPEVAWVTKSGDTDLAEPIAIRPTSETVMYPAYAKWVQSYRDLPIKLNQWNNVVRWEFKHPQPFLRTREFLWQEGHTAYASATEAEQEVITILNLYEQVYTDLLAIPVIKGRKTEKEKFAGGYYTTTVEAYVSASGRAIQGATSHHLGQNFSKMFEITFEDPETKEKKFVFQNSWGITTRTIGVMIMIHADNKGLVLPPRVACVQVVIVPCGITSSSTKEERSSLESSCIDLENELKHGGLRVHGDYRDNYSPAWRYNHWELKGVPVRVELGPKDIAKQQILAVRRDTGEKVPLARKNAVKELSILLDTIQCNLLARAKKDLDSHVIKTHNWIEFCQKLDEKNLILSPYCGSIECEDQIKKESGRDDAEPDAGAPSMGAKGLCTPFVQPAAIAASDKCINPSCVNKPKQYTLFGRSY